MSNTRSSRGHLMSALRDATVSSPWLARYGLLLAASKLDLVQLGELYDDVSEAVSAPYSDRVVKLAKLLEERFG